MEKRHWPSFQEEKPDIVLLDVKMPGMDGIETLKRLKKLDEKIGVIMITGLADEKLGQKCMELGAYDYIVKPFNETYLKVCVLSKILLMD